MVVNCASRLWIGEGGPRTAERGKGRSEGGRQQTAREGKAHAKGGLRSNLCVDMSQRNIYSVCWWDASYLAFPLISPPLQISRFAWNCLPEPPWEGLG